MNQTTTEDKVLDFQHQGRPSAVPRGFCPVCRGELVAEAIGFCETDWRWEHKRHLSTQMHGNINEAKDRKEPIVYLTRKDAKWEREQI